MKNLFLLGYIMLFFLYGEYTYAQIRVDNNSNVIVGAESNADASAKFEIESSTLGFLKPRLTNAEMLAISNPALGLEVFNLDEGTTYYFNGSAWVPYTSNGLGIQWSDILQIPPGFADGIDHVDDADSNPSNEIQNLSFDPVSGMLNIENGIGVNLSLYSNYWTKSGNNLFYDAGEISIGTSTASGYADLTIESGRIYVANSENNAFFGKNAGKNNSQVTQIGIGYQALMNATGGSSTAIGYKSGLSNSGSSLMALGYRAAEQNSGNNVVAIGHTAGLVNSGANNIFVGNQAGSSNTSGSNNTFIGPLAGSSNTIGERNVVIGWDALKAGGNDSDNGVYIGAESGLNAGGDWNVAIGGGSLKNGTGGANVAIGYNALGANASSNNTAVGVGAGQNSSGSNNVFLGNNAGYTESGSDKLFIENSNSLSPLIYGEFDNDVVKINGTFGYTVEGGTAISLLGKDASGNLTESGTNVIAESLNYWNKVGANLKYEAGDVIVGSTSNPGVFHSYGQILNRHGASTTMILSPTYYNNPGLTGNANILFGPEAGISLTTGNRNFFMGQTSGRDMDEGILNIFMGNSSGQQSLNAQSNIAIGTDAFREGQGNKNIVIGDHAGVHNDGESNIYIGKSAGQGITTTTQEHDNVFIGNQSGQKIHSGQKNLALGLYSLYTIHDGDDNIAFGYGALYNMTNGDKNVAIGKQAGYNVTGTQSGNIFLGNQAGYYETGSNKLYIDNSNINNPLIYGDFFENEIEINGELRVSDRSGTAITAAGFDDSGKLVEYTLPAITGTTNNDQSFRKMMDEKDSKISKLEDEVKVLKKEIESIKKMLSQIQAAEN